MRVGLCARYYSNAREVHRIGPGERCELTILLAPVAHGVMIGIQREGKCEGLIAANNSSMHPGSSGAERDIIAMLARPSRTRGDDRNLWFELPRDEKLAESLSWFRWIDSLVLDRHAQMGGYRPG